jgi:signal transduction histidine kinase
MQYNTTINKILLAVLILFFSNSYAQYFFQLDKALLDALSLLEEIKSRAGVGAQQKGLKFVFMKHHVIPTLFIGDEMRLSQIINN